MTSISPLKEIIKKGLFGDNEGKKDNEIVKIKEITKLLIVQVVQYKNSSLKIKELTIDKLTFPNEALGVNSNKDTRILWNGPKNWLLVSNKKDLLSDLKESL